MNSIFISGIGTGIGKTIIAAIVCRALQGDYWKPVQAGTSEITDSEWIRSVLPASCTVYPEKYKLKMAASPHIAATRENIEISISEIVMGIPSASGNLIIEGAGGLMVPLNQKDFVLDLIAALGSKVILVSRNYLGSINHSLMTAEICSKKGMDIAGWIFNDQYLNYEDDVSRWTGIPKIASIPYTDKIDAAFVSEQATKWKERLLTHLC